MSLVPMHSTAAISFGILLKQLRKRAGMTQRDLAAALGYSDSLISSLEKTQRQPDLDAVIQRFIPALGLQDDPKTATKLIGAAAFAHGQALPAAALAPHTYKAAQCQRQQRYRAWPSRPARCPDGRASDPVHLIDAHFDLRPGAIIRDLDLRRPIYRQTAAYGHFYGI